MAGVRQALLLKSTGRRAPDAALPTVPLAAGSGLRLLPLTAEIQANLVPDSPRVDGFHELTSGVADWARRCSDDSDVAYLHTELFGGNGFHATVAWRGGEVALGPLFTATSAGEAEEHYTVVTNRRDSAVNVLLRWWGVHCGDQTDEFAAAGLNRCRWTEEWAALTAPTR